MAFFTGLYDSRSQPYVVTSRNTKSNLPSACSLQSSLMGRKAALVLGSDGRSLVSHRTVPLSSPSCIPWQLYGGEGGEMAITVQMQFTSAVTEIYQDAFVGSSIANGTTVIQFDLSQHDFQQ